MEMITIPDMISEINKNDNIVIDMSNLKFETDKNQQKYNALLCLRNIGKSNKANFDNCSYDDKEEYLKLFLTTNIDSDIPILASTWMNILLFDEKEESIQDSFLSKDEIKKFIKDNNEFVLKVKRFINSLSYYAINKYRSVNNNISMDDLECIDDKEIKPMNIFYLSLTDAFILLFNTSDNLDVTPGYYTLFNDDDYQFEFERIMNNLPFINILNLLFAPAELQNAISNKFNKLLQEGDQNESNS